MIQKNKKRVKLYTCIIMLIFSLSLIRLVNASIEKTSTEQIIISLDYKTGTIYDEDNDGIETIEGIVDLTVENTDFSYAIDKNKLCTLWKTYSFDNGKSSNVCYGSEQCCNFVDLIPNRDDWNAIFYSNYGRYGTTYNNIISTRIIHTAYNLSEENPYADISYSDWSNLFVKYIEIKEELGLNNNLDRLSSHQGKTNLEKKREEVSELFDITISTPPTFATKKNQFDVLIILTNYGKGSLDNISSNIMLGPCLTTNDRLEQTISNLEAGKNRIIELSITKNEGCSFEDYIMVTADDKFVLKEI